MNSITKHALRIAKLINWAAILFVAVWLGFGPAAITLWGVTDPALRTGDTPRFAAWAHKRLTPRMAHWAATRQSAHTVVTRPPDSIASEEWPLFSAAFYGWATQAMHRAHREDPGANPSNPRAYAAEALRSLAALSLDPAEGAWTRALWGADYQTQENAFYRMLVVANLAAHGEVTGSAEYHAVLRAWADALAEDIDQSPTGLIHDFPRECYPGDVLAALAAVQDAGQVLGISREPFFTRAKRGFTGGALHALGAPPFEAWLGQEITPGAFRGSSNAYVSIMGPHLWPEESAAWFSVFEQHLWQERLGLVGFREYLHDESFSDWEYLDVDAGPVLAGFGMAATAYGVGAARAQGRFDRAFPLAAQMIAGAWPLPDGTLLLPRMLSQGVHAPHLGETGILFNLVQRPAYASTVAAQSGLPLLVYEVLALYIGVATLLCFAVARDIRRWRRTGAAIRLPRLQCALWAALWAAGGVVYLTGATAGLALLALGVLLPRQGTRRKALAPPPAIALER